MTDTWMGIGPAAITGYGGELAGSGSGGVTSGTETAVTTPAEAHAPLYSPDNPLFWFGLLLLAAGGLIYVSTEAKAGPFKAEVTV